MQDQVNSPFTIDGPPLLTSLLKKFTGLQQLEDRYHTMKRGQTLFYQSVLDELDIEFELSDEDRAKVPQDGPVMLLANHPFGAIDGLILAVLAKNLRPKSKILANQLLGRLAESNEVLIYVDVFAQKNSKRNNVKGMRAATDWLKEGNCLGVFPSGEVAAWAPKKASVMESEWNPHFAKMARRTGATVVPVYFAGRNSLAFQVASQIHPYLKLAMLPGEILKKQHLKIQLRLGKPIEPAKFSRYPQDTDLIAYLRQRTLLLSQRNQAEDLVTKARQRVEMTPIVESLPCSLLQDEIDALAPDRLLLDAGDYHVYCAKSAEIPHCLREIGRLRELSFRAVGEGTGKSLDLDLYDEYYLHLFLWHKASQEIAGAYRIGKSDQIFQRYRKKGFYSQSLFKFKSDFFREIGPALEMGRSFVSPNYQKSFAPLSLLWKGIAAFISQNPQYKTLFGPVSISKDFGALSKEMMIGFLEAQSQGSDLASLVKPRIPFKGKLVNRLGLNGEFAKMDLTQLNDAVEELEAGQRSVPILLKQYLKLGAKVLAFNLDPGFNDCLDGLILVDLLKTDPKNLEKYLGKTEAVAFLAIHQTSVPLPK
ncbi:MAG: hypothetical protein A2508_01935 [Candidatus Lambdaproteobacteria bacterium RIFOXYD12_FULL_49_8]|uniref:L-ornithine N(alpha)-acyltransferase n=1 Tax=Candidatus Lambdaproteobacteria bacterium RIFOXYD2_FULL_50_16 TaxID=1817772 RepID=A0A1F6G9A9_9PROT|nr:MAG: hypothetical protein A2527_05730 [Candidatus Lambdaproteobacteria bacterium RIFOXYD2_FULL_50_16]OGG98190.1 MAG: hypothetical protein A2508_01935 [Candidatus Lambdaproteobacteria bacterium RIFOXYD12_FULL_49_8]